MDVACVEVSRNPLKKINATDAKGQNNRMTSVNGLWLTTKCDAMHIKSNNARFFRTKGANGRKLS